MPFFRMASLGSALADVEIIAGDKSSGVVEKVLATANIRVIGGAITVQSHYVFSSPHLVELFGHAG